MKVIKSSFEIRQCLPYEEVLKIVEHAGRLCYLSDKDEDPESFIRKRIKGLHHSILEHVKMSVHFVTSRGVSHELVRHRLASYSQTSTRYVNYGGKDMEFIEPYWLEDSIMSKIPTNALKFRGIDFPAYNPEDLKPGLVNIEPANTWLMLLQRAEDSYNALLKAGLPPQAARGVLPNDLKTEIMMSCNLRQWRDVISKRSSIAATGAPHPDIKILFDRLLTELRRRLPVFFEDLYEQYGAKLYGSPT